MRTVSKEVFEMDREQLTNLLEAVRSVRAGVFQMEQELLSALSAE